MLGTSTPSFVVTSEPPGPRSPPGSLEDMDSALGSPSLDPKNTNHSSSQCSSMSDGESYECLGEGSPAPSPVVNKGESPGMLLKRNTWSRSSLRRTPTNTSPGGDSAIGRRWGSLRQTIVVEEATQKIEQTDDENSSGKRISANGASVPSGLCRSASFNSSGRSSNCGDPDDMYCSDASLEEDVMGLNRKVHMLQQQVTALADTQNTSDDRYGRARHENALLQARLMILEEQVREEQSRAEQRLQEEQRRQKDLSSRLEREKQLELENSAIRLQAAERRSEGLEEEVKRLRGQLERASESRRVAEEMAQEADAQTQVLRAQLAEAHEEAAKTRITFEQKLADAAQSLEEARLEVSEAARGRPASPGRSPELEEEARCLREEVRTLKEALEEAQAQLLGRGLEQGRTLLGEPVGGPSLADELDEMSSDKVNVRLALREQQEVNVQLRAYIDGILLNIVENYPQLLEVKTAEGHLK
ncbi:rab11 family-interacting protein 4 isoform X1 [Neocloeon triangulifer]|uniref:rab11 family-interacting protein 4 isoform X1 n=1 Tax=Neocloeon triangulifer TaxID=2078957 RepID=UPI00286F7DCA|nr:rab11 family-interacting protein 4 isoform X1 [Neocloeon triangulifer]